MLNGKTAGPSFIFQEHLGRTHSRDPLATGTVCLGKFSFLERDVALGERRRPNGRFRNEGLTRAEASPRKPSQTFQKVSEQELVCACVHSWGASDQSQSLDANHPKAVPSPSNKVPFIPPLAGCLPLTSLHSLA